MFDFGVESVEDAFVVSVLRADVTMRLDGPANKRASLGSRCPGVTASPPDEDPGQSCVFNLQVCGQRIDFSFQARQLTPAIMMIVRPASCPTMDTVLIGQ